MGGVGELLGHFYDQCGRPVAQSIARRALSVGPQALDTGRIVAIAGGRHKTEAMRAILRTGFLHELITDEQSARALLANQSGGADDKD